MIHIDTGIPIAHIYMMAANLEHWGKARIIEKFSTNNIYVLNSACESLQSRELKDRFHKRFPSLSLAEELHRFSSLRSVGEHIADLTSPQAQREFIDLLIWLLREDIVEQLFQYPYLILVPPISSSTGAASLRSDTTKHNDSINGNYASDDDLYDQDDDGDDDDDDDDDEGITRWLEASNNDTKPLTRAERKILNTYNDGTENFALLLRYAARDAPAR
jgi:hypothetical protein